MERERARGQVYVQSRPMRAIISFIHVDTLVIDTYDPPVNNPFKIPVWIPFKS